MSSLLIVVQSHLFPQFVHLNLARGKVTAVTSSGHWDPGERGEVVAGWVGMAWHSGARRRGGSSQWRWAGNPLEARLRLVIKLLTTLTHNRYILGIGVRVGLGSRRTR